MTAMSLRDQVVYMWVNRLRDRLAEVAPGVVDELIVSERSKGYRLGDGVVCVGLELREEVVRFRTALKRGTRPQGAGED